MNIKLKWQSWKKHSISGVIPHEKVKNKSAWEGVGSSLDEANDPYNEKGEKDNAQEKGWGWGRGLWSPEQSEMVCQQPCTRNPATERVDGTQLGRENPGSREMVRKIQHYLLVATMALLPNPAVLKEKATLWSQRGYFSFFFFLLAIQSLHIYSIA